MARVSVVLTVYNKPTWLAQSIESVLNQTYEDWELLLMEDNSPDPAVREIIESYHDERIKVYYSGVGEADRYKTNRYATLINKAVKSMSTGEYITYLCDDDYYYPQRLAVLSNALDQHPNWNVVFSCQQVVDVDGNARGMRQFKEPMHKAYDAVDHNSVMHTRRVYDLVGGWSESPNSWGGGDSFFFRALNQAGFVFMPVAPDVPLEAKRYHVDSVQWKIANNVFFPEK